MYTYIQSRFYRAPEVILGISYGTPIDMWSFGCILAELYTGYPLFPGENEVHQLACIQEVLGLPPPEILNLATRKNYFYGNLSLLISKFHLSFFLTKFCFFFQLLLENQE